MTGAEPVAGQGIGGLSGGGAGSAAGGATGGLSGGAAGGLSESAARTVVVVLPAALRDEADGRSTVTVAVGLPAGAPARSAGPTVGAVLDALAVAHPRLERRLRDERGTLRRHVNVFVAGDDCRAFLGQDTPVPDGAEVVVLPNIAGG